MYITEESIQTCLLSTTCYFLSNSVSDSVSGFAGKCFSLHFWMTAVPGAYAQIKSSCLLLPCICCVLYAGYCWDCCRDVFQLVLNWKLVFCHRCALPSINRNRSIKNFSVVVTHFSVWLYPASLLTRLLSVRLFCFSLHKFSKLPWPYYLCLTLLHLTLLTLTLGISDNRTDENVQQEVMETFVYFLKIHNCQS